MTFPIKPNKDVLGDTIKSLGYNFILWSYCIRLKKVYVQVSLCTKPRTGLT